MKYNHNHVDHKVRASQSTALALMFRETTLDTMQPCASLKVFNTRIKRIDQIAIRATRCL